MGTFVIYMANNPQARGYLALPEGGKGPGIILCHAWWGLNSFFQELADRLAQEGFAVLAPDIYDGRLASTIDEAEALLQTMKSSEAIKYETAAVDYLLVQPYIEGSRLGAIGFSLGAMFAAELAPLRQQVGAVVLFYGGTEVDEDYPSRTAATFLGHFAEEDEWEPAEPMHQLEKGLRAAGKLDNFYIYPGTGHWFFENDRPEAYNSEAAALAWERTIAFLHEQLR